MSDKPRDLGPLLRSRPTIDQMWREFAAGSTAAVPTDPALAAHIEATFKIGACFACFAIMDTFADERIDAVGAINYMEQLEDEARAWVAAMAAADKGPVN